MTQTAQMLYADGGRLAPPVVTREQARSAGMTRYFTGVPCMRGHIAERHVSNTRCVECHREKASQARALNPTTKARVDHRASVAAASSGITGKKLVSRREAKDSGLTRYFTGIPCANGHVSERLTCDHSCVACNRENAAAERARNPEAARRRARKSYQRHIEKQRASAREHMRAKFKADPEAFRLKRRERRAADPIIAFKHRARQMVRAAFIRSGHRKAKKTEALLGCTLDEFRVHIERQFLPGMGWENMSLWEIDHIVAMATATTQDEAEALNKFTNLRPLWREQNRSKAAKSTHLL